MIKGHFTTISGHFFANYITIDHKTEIQTIILRCFKRSKSWLVQKLWLKMQTFPFLVFCDIVKKTHLYFLRFFAFCVITFVPIMIQTCSAPQNNRLNLSFLKNVPIVGNKRARKNSARNNSARNSATYLTIMCRSSSFIIDIFLTWKVLLHSKKCRIGQHQLYCHWLSFDTP